ncbi:hypothetical protein [Gordonia sp. (in: high G+C Gram-positive bacteria)]|uniref:hypothetical protein n=1 Tax=Gordonia sp. (in: high G+C Gram-positive bacteria) TaxID=84139 RepID=UPI001695761D|nr:hypothetical protein [Gordonia sp. (in: high G+C Gram-positive bacteria)]NLG44967.1 hypothetical protein [Gordonia sp. (in: high G+C Gram-positive bacteria)]
MIRRIRLLAFALLTLALTVTGVGLNAGQAQALPANFTVTAANPSVQDLDDIVEFLVETNASDEAKARNLEGGMNAVIVPRTVYNLGIFRAPKGWNKITGITSRSSNSILATLQAGSAGRPTVNVTVEFKKIGNWKLSNNSLCQGVKTVGLNIYCNA